MLRQSTCDPNFYRHRVDASTYVPYELIKSIDFSILTTKEIEALSVCEIDTTTLYKKSLPRVGSVNDPRLGPIDTTLICGTCHNTLEHCNGHFGHITLPVPVYNTLFLGTIVKSLRCICPHCFQAIADISHFGTPRDFEQIWIFEDKKQVLSLFETGSDIYTNCI